MNKVTTDNRAQELMNLADDWANAELHSDTAFMQKHLMDDFVAVGPRGFLLTKPEWIQRYQSGDLKYDSFQWQEDSVRIYGNTAILIGQQTQKAKYQNQEVPGQFRVTLNFVKPDSDWQLAGLHMSPMAGRP